MISFDVIFNSVDEIEFIDNSDYLLEGIDILNITESYLLIFPPIISNSNSIRVDLFNTNINNVGENLIINDSILPSTNYVDGVYNFQYNFIIGGSTTVNRLTKIKSIDLKRCKKNLIKRLISEELKDCCEISSFESILSSAEYEASLGQYKEAEELIAYLKEKCNIEICC